MLLTHPMALARRLSHHLRSASLVLMIFGAVAANAQTTPMRLLVGFLTGGGTDAIARLLADKLKDALGTAVVVDNKAGAGGQIAAQTLKAAVADGDTLLLFHDHTISILPLVIKNPGFDSAPCGPARRTHLCETGPGRF